MLSRCWRDHSLTIIGAGFMALAWPFRPSEGVAWDYVIGLGHGTLAVALYNVLAGYWRERNKPEE